MPAGIIRLPSSTDKPLWDKIIRINLYGPLNTHHAVAPLMVARRGGRISNIASDTAKFGQVGPKVGSVDGGWGTALLARHIGDKKAREMWFLNEQYRAPQALEMGLINKVVPAAELDAAVDAWTETLGERSPTALALAKRSFNADSENIRGISQMALNAVKLFYDSEESKEGVRAFTERRKPDFHKYVK